MDGNPSFEPDGVRPSPSRKGGGCLRKLAIVLSVGAAVGLCGGSIFLVSALRSESGQAAIVSWALVEGHDGIVVALSDRLIERSPDIWLHYRRKALSLRRLGRHDQSLAVYETAISALPDMWWPQSHRCFYGALYDDPQVALVHCDKSIALQPSDPDVAYFRRSLARALVGDLDGAVADMEASLSAIEAESATGERSSRRTVDLAEEQAEWLDALEAGRNPFDEETLSDLRLRYLGPAEPPPDE